MIWAVAIALGLVIAAGTYLALSRNLLRCLIGLAMIGNGVNLLVFAAGRLGSQLPPIIAAGEQQLGAAANPLPQALVLTAIVISFVLLCFSLVLALRLRAAAGSDDLEAMRAAEPSPRSADQPVIEERA
ncbi:MAG: NADH-quinone oxidoreductase subunit K [Propionivibrio sp.]|nr:NADH-quinone oxidoreductase subunit K [Propionivibrio sp.]